MRSPLRQVTTAFLTMGLGLWPVDRALGATAPDACGLLQQADVAAAFAPRPFGPAKAGPVIVKVTPKNAHYMAQVTDCAVASTEAKARDRLTVGLNLRRAPTDATGVTPEKAKEGAAALKATPVAVAGLGAGAYWIDLGTRSRPSIQLNVFRGQREWLLFSAAGPGLEPAVLLDGLTKVAKATLARP